MSKLVTRRVRRGKHVKRMKRGKRSKRNGYSKKHYTRKYGRRTRTRPRTKRGGNGNGNVELEMTQRKTGAPDEEPSAPVEGTGASNIQTSTPIDDTDPKPSDFNFTTVNGPWPKKFNQIALTELGKGFAKVTKLNDKGETARFSKTDRTEQLIIYTAHNGTVTQPVFYIARCPSDQCEEGKNMESNILETRIFTRDDIFPNSYVYRFMSGSDNYRIKPLHSNSKLSTLLHRFDNPNFDTTNITKELIEASNVLYNTAEFDMSRQNHTPPSLSHDHLSDPYKNQRSDAEWMRRFGDNIHST